MKTTFAVVLAGGRGTRFWPRSRRLLPKQCLVVEGQRTLLQQTVDRIEGLVPAARVLVVTGPDMAEAVTAQLPDVPAKNILVEPRGRNTAPPIAWAMAEIERRGGDAMMVLPADHRITDLGAFHQAMQAALAAARATGALVTLGQRPTRPETGYGYLALGEPAGTWAGQEVHSVERFVEKPDTATAEAYLRAGDVLWNGGMFVWTIEALDEEITRQLPRTARAVGALRSGVPCAEVWDRLDATSIDYGIMEHALTVLTVPCAFGWSDLGAWQAMAEVYPETELGPASVAAAVARDASECIVHAPEHLVAMIGVRDLVVVHTDDVLLISTRDRADEVPDVLAELERRGLDRYL